MAEKDDRRADLYRAAMQQFEDLLTAAASIGPAASPLPLYYALNQAGRAVLAAREADDSKVFAGKEHHGLTLARQTVGVRTIADVPKAAFCVPTHASRPDERGVGPWIACTRTAGDTIDAVDLLSAEALGRELSHSTG